MPYFWIIAFELFPADRLKSFPAHSQSALPTNGPPLTFLYLYFYGMNAKVNNYFNLHNLRREYPAGALRDPYGHVVAPTNWFKQDNTKKWKPTRVKAIFLF